MSHSQLLMVNYFPLLIGVPLGILALILLSNLPFILRLTPPPLNPPQRGGDQKSPSLWEGLEEGSPFVSILVPARNEEAVIGRLITHLLNQTYINYELIILDDNSIDGTGGIGRAFNDERLTIIEGEPLPAGWLGKNWACHQLSQHARGDILIFTDADVIWQEDGVAAVITLLTQCNADMLSVFPTQITKTWGERLTVPLMALVILAYLPHWGAHFLPFSFFAAANGQCITFCRSFYDKMGGHTVVCNKILEDVALARVVKKMHGRLRVVDGNRLVQCRMYESWRDVVHGYGKNIVVAYGGVLGVLVATIFHVWLFLFPTVWLMFAVLTGGDWMVPAALTLLGMAVRGATAALTHQRIGDALLMPISVLAMTRIAWQGVRWHVQGNTQWKGRTIS